MAGNDTATIAPVLPPLPQAAPREFNPELTPAAHDSLWREWDVYLRRLALNNDAILRVALIAASQAHGTAQGNTAAAMDANVTAQRALAAAMLAPVPHAAPSDEQVMLSMVRDMLSAGLSGSGLVDEAKRQLAAYKAATAKPFPAPV
jgi:hypothetical protein